MKNKLPPAIRIGTQLILCLPMLFLLSVFGVLLSGATIQDYHMFIHDGGNGASKLIGNYLAVLGGFGLATSILTPMRVFQTNPLMRIITITLIVFGYLSLAAMFYYIWRDHDYPYGWDGSTVWILGGPIVVGAWNLVRIQRCSPSKSRLTGV